MTTNLCYCPQQGKEKISNACLEEAINEINQELIDADLGGGLIKKQIAKQGQGKRGGYRVFIAFKQGNRCFFMFGFSKNNRENLDKDELDLYKKLAKFYLNAPIQQINKMKKEGKFIEVNYEKK